MTGRLFINRYELERIIYRHYNLGNSGVKLEACYEKEKDKKILLNFKAYPMHDRDIEFLFMIESSPK